MIIFFEEMKMITDVIYTLALQGFRSLYLA